MAPVPSFLILIQSYSVVLFESQCLLCYKPSFKLPYFIGFLCCVLLTSPVSEASSSPEQPVPTSTFITKCSELRIGQFLCSDPEIDPSTQQPVNCSREGIAAVNCTAAPGITCTETNRSTFSRNITCEWTNGKSFEVALLLSIFLGFLGIDRIYLGYPAIGLIKFSTFGFLFIGHLIDVVLIATQVVGPSDGSSYIINYFGPKLTILQSGNSTFRVSQGDWQ